MRPLSEATARIASKSFERKYISLGRILENWPTVVGEALASKTQPLRIIYRKKDDKGVSVATLEIAVSAAEATLLHYQKDLILERINQVFGEKWVSALRFVHSPANSTPRRLRKPQKPLTSHEKKHLSDILQEIADEEIRHKLESLGQAILTENMS